MTIILFSTTVSAISYLDEDGTLKESTTATALPTNDPLNLNDGWYYVSGTVTYTQRINIGGHVRIILENGSHLTAIQGINVPESHKLTIYAQTNDTSSMGKLTANGNIGQAGIGGNHDQNAGNITINGGNITATGRDGGAGIGGGREGAGGTITINGGTVTATGGTNGGAGIGGGRFGAGGVITINGGTLTATGRDGGAGIGGGLLGDGGTIIITGGTIEATGGNGVSSAVGGGGGAGIGGGAGNFLSTSGASGSISIMGTAIVTAKGGTADFVTGAGGGAGIGSGGSGTSGNVGMTGDLNNLIIIENRANVDATGGKGHGDSDGAAIGFGGGSTGKGAEKYCTPSDWIGTDPTCTTPGSRHKECTVCGHILESEIIPVIPHSYGAGWKSNSTHHWYECDCGDKTNEATHTSSDWITTTPATHTTVGSKHKECTICGHIILSETIPVIANPDNNNTSNNTTNPGNNNTTKPDDNSSSNNNKNNNNNNNNKGNISNLTKNTPTYYSNQIPQDSYTNDTNNTNEENIHTIGDCINTDSKEIDNDNLNLANVLIAVFLLVGVGVIIFKMRK